MLGLQKQHKQRHSVLEEQLVELLVRAMERAEVEPELTTITSSSIVSKSGGDSSEETDGIEGEMTERASNEMGQQADELGVSHWLWHHLSSQIIYFVLFQFASFSHLVTLLHEKLAEKKLRKGKQFFVYNFIWREKLRISHL